MYRTYCDKCDALLENNHVSTSKEPTYRIEVAEDKGSYQSITLLCTPCATTRLLDIVNQLMHTQGVRSIQVIRMKTSLQYL